MATTTKYLNGSLRVGMGHNVAVYTEPRNRWESMDFAHGDVLEVYLNPVNWVVSISSLTFTQEGNTGTRLFDIEFRYSVDGGNTYTAWANVSTISGVTGLTSARLHICLRFTRIGADTSGVLTLHGWRFLLTLNPLRSNNPLPFIPVKQATLSNSSGKRSWDSAVNINARVREFVRGLSEGMVSDYATPARGYGFHSGHPDTCKADYTKPFIYVYAIQQLREESGLKATVRIQFRIGVKRSVMSVRHPGEQETFDIFQNQLNEVFGPNWGANYYDILVFDSVKYHGVNMAGVGVSSMRTFGSVFTYSDGGGDGKAECGHPESWECVGEILVRIPNLGFNYIGF
jgi:hypothetical protein